MQETTSDRRPSTPPEADRSLRILAKSVYRELKANGHSLSLIHI